MHLCVLMAVHVRLVRLGQALTTQLQEVETGLFISGWPLPVCTHLGQTLMHTLSLGAPCATSTVQGWLFQSSWRGCGAAVGRQRRSEPGRRVGEAGSSTSLRGSPSWSLSPPARSPPHRSGLAVTWGQGLSEAKTGHTGVGNV